MLGEIRMIIGDWLLGLVIKIYPTGPESKRLALLIKYHLTMSLAEAKARHGIK